MARIGFCAMLSRREELRDLAHRLHDEGHDTVSIWIWRDDHDEDLNDAHRMYAMLENFNDLSRAEVVVLFGENPGTPGADRGGRFVDFGSTLYRGASVRRIVVGPRENLGAFWPGVEHVADADALVELLGQNKRT